MIKACDESHAQKRILSVIFYCYKKNHNVFQRSRAFKISRRPPELRRVLRGLSPVTFLNIYINKSVLYLFIHAKASKRSYSSLLKLSMTISIPFLFESNQCLCFKNVDFVIASIGQRKSNIYSSNPIEMYP